MKNKKISGILRPAIIALVSILLIVAAGLTGCKLSSLTVTKTDEPVTPPPENNDVDINHEVKNETDDPAPAPIVKSYNVLTGLETTSELADLRPVAISISNDAYSLPQYGISGADILVEVPLEDGSTRLTILTTSYRNMTTIGAVASTRSYLMEICAAFHAIQCFNGSDGEMSAETLAVYDTLDYESQNLSGMYYYDDTRFDETDLMTNGILIDAGIRKAALCTTATGDYMPFRFAEEGTKTPAGTSLASRIAIRYSADLNVSFVYDEATQKYVRYEYGEKQIDAADHTEVSFDNLFILCASSVVYESEEKKTLDLVVEDGGSGYYLSGGTYTKITWKYAEDGTLAFFDENGQTLTVNRGTSYIGFVTAGARDSVTIY